MNLATHAAVLWRFRAVVAVGLILGIVSAILAAYQVSWDGGPALKARGLETWTSRSSLLVTQAGFPEGRVTLPAAPPPGSPTGTTPVVPESSKGELEFADPLRFSFLAQLYAQLAVSDRVLKHLPGNPAREQVEAVPVEGVAATQLPVIQLTTTAGTAEAAKALNTNLVEALRGFLASDQARAGISAEQRTRVEPLSAPEAPIKTAGRSHTASILALLLCLLGAVAVAHLLAALRSRREGNWGEGGTGAMLADEPFAWDDDDGSNGIIVPWTAGARDDQPAHQSVVPVGGNGADLDSESGETRASTHRRVR